MSYFLFAFIYRCLLHRCYFKIHIPILYHVWSGGSILLSLCRSMIVDSLCLYPEKDKGQLRAEVTAWDKHSYTQY